MKLQYKTSEIDELHSIYIKRTHQPHVGGDWHFHEEFELIYFLKGRGMRIVGDHVSHFSKGELVLVGEWLPHLWRNEVDDNGEALADFIVIKFRKTIGGLNVFSIPELSGIKKLLRKSVQGIQFSTDLVEAIEPLLLRLVQSKSTNVIITFLQVLDTLAKSKKFKLLADKNFVLPSPESTDSRLQNVINHISINYNKGVTLEEVSELACMTAPSFCRFFKNRTNKTFSSFLNEVKVSKACQLLINGEKSINQICYEVGFNSLTNFNRTFRSFKEMTPSIYREKYTDFRT